MDRAENFSFKYDLDHVQWSVVSGQWSVNGKFTYLKQKMEIFSHK